MKLTKELFFTLVLIVIPVLPVFGQGLNTVESVFTVEIQTVTPDFATFESMGQQTTSSYIRPVRYQEQSDSDDRKRGFFRRYKYWIIGGVTAAAVGTYIIVNSSGDGPEMLPEPPPRPS